MIVLQLPEVKRNKMERPTECPNCQGETFQRWGKYQRKVKYPKIKTVTIYRYRCTSCGQTFRYYPEGISAARQSERMKKLAVICWLLGLSYRGIEMILIGFWGEFEPNERVAR